MIKIELESNTVAEMEETLKSLLATFTGTTTIPQTKLAVDDIAGGKAKENIIKPAPAKPTKPAKPIPTPAKPEPEPEPEPDPRVGLLEGVCLREGVVLTRSDAALLLSIADAAAPTNP